MPASRISRRLLQFVALLALIALPSSVAFAAGLRGSRASMLRQHQIAVQLDLAFMHNATELRDYAADSRLVRVASTHDLTVTEDVSFAYTRWIVKLFLDRIAAQYHTAMGVPLVVTSLTRPIANQPRNASPLSVHPAGMAVDLRVPATAAQRAWLEQTLLSLEGRGLLDVTKERHPPHYHVAVFLEQYATYLVQQGVDTTFVAPPPAAEPAPESAASVVTRASVASQDASGSNGLRFFLLSAIGYLLAVIVAGVGTLRTTKR